MRNLALALLLAGSAAAADMAPASTLLGLAQRASIKGAEASLGAGATKYLHLQEIVLKVMPEIGVDEATDGFSHDFYVGLSEGYLACVVLAAHKNVPPKIKATYFKADMNGKLERVVSLSGQSEEDGSAVHGSGLISPLDPTDEAQLKGFRHELDLWLKGKYRKPSALKPLQQAPAKPAESKPAQGSETPAKQP